MTNLRSALIAVTSGIVFSLGVVSADVVKADEPLTFSVSIKNHKFLPDRVEVPAGKPFILMIKNQDPTAEEFESHDLHREKMIGGNAEVKIRIDALKPGNYKFVGEFNEDSAKGVIVAK